MINGVNAVNYQTYKREINKNNLKHNLAGGAVAFTGGAALWATNKYTDSKIVKTIDNGLTKGAEFITNGGLKETYNQAYGYAKNGYKNVKNHMPDMPNFKPLYDKLPDGVKELLSKTKSGIKSIAAKAQKSTMGFWNIAKGPLTKGWNKTKGFATDLLNKFAKLPAKYKVGGAIAVLTLMLIESIKQDKAYNKGKIDAQYGK